VNLQPADHLLFFKQFSKMYPSAFTVSGPDGRGGGGQTFTKTFLGQLWMCIQNFTKIRARVWISINPPHINRQTNKQTSVQPFIYIDTS